MQHQGPRLKAEQNMINSYWLLQRVKLLLIELSMPRLANDSDGLGELAALLCTPDDSDEKETDGEIQALMRGGAEVVAPAVQPPMSLVPAGFSISPLVQAGPMAPTSGGIAEPLAAVQVYLHADLWHSNRRSHRSCSLFVAGEPAR